MGLRTRLTTLLGESQQKQAGSVCKSTPIIQLKKRQIEVGSDPGHSWTMGDRLLSAAAVFLGIAIPICLVIGWFYLR